LLQDGELVPWLEQTEDPFKVPQQARRVPVTGRLRLLWQEWPRPYNKDKVMALSYESWADIEHFLSLPKSFIFDYESQKHVPSRVVQHQGRTGECLSMYTRQVRSDIVYS
jgi:hypothetical protein